MLGNSALSTNESPPVFRDEKVSCVELTRRNTRVDVRWFLSSLFAGGPHTRSRSRDVKIEAIAEARNRDSLLCGTCGTPIMDGISSEQPGWPLDRGEADVTAIDHPRVSVALPVHNCERYVAEAIESILAQTFTDFEFLIVDDGSTDGSLAILQRYAARDQRIQLVSRPNTGYLVALNEMLARARGEYVARMDADDIALPERFDHQIRYLEDHPECVMVGSRVTLIDPDGAPIMVMGEALTHEEIDNALMMAQGQLVYHPVVMFRRQVVLDLGGYRPEYYTTEDLDLFLRLAEVGRIVNLAEPLLKYREHLQKIGYRRAGQQEAAARRTLTDAYRRRGLDLPKDLLDRCRRGVEPSQVLASWAWMALGAGHVATARKHALTCIRRAPLSLSTWRLVYCALRGH